MQWEIVYRFMLTCVESRFRGSIAAIFGMSFTAATGITRSQVGRFAYAFTRYAAMGWVASFGIQMQLVETGRAETKRSTYRASNKGCTRNVCDRTRAIGTVRSTVRSVSSQCIPCRATSEHDTTGSPLLCLLCSYRTYIQ